MFLHINSKTRKIDTDLIDKFPDSYQQSNHGNLQIAIWGRIYSISSDKLMSTNDISQLYLKKKHEWVNLVMGSFVVYIIDSENDEISVYNDRNSTKPIYYFCSEKNYVIDVNYIKLVQQMKDLNGKINISISSAYQLMSFSYMLGENTIVEGANKLRSGSYIKIDKSGFKVIEYHEFSNESKIDKLDQAIDIIDSSLEKAMQREVEWDINNDKRKLYTLSGGLDSRVVYFMGKRLGYGKFDVFTYAAKDSLDEKISNQISTHYKDNFFLYNIDSCNHIYDWNRSIELNFGNVNYHGTTGLVGFINSLNTSEYGVLHTGGLGEGGFGGYLKDSTHTNYGKDIFPEEKWLIERFKSDFDAEYSKYPNDEMFIFRNRAINGMINFFLVANNFMECGSIFLDYDFLNKSLSVSPKIRYNRKLMEAYICKKFPESNKFIVEKYGTKLDASKLTKFATRAKRSFKYRVLKKSDTMNPYDKWYMQNNEFKSFIDNIKSEFPNVIKDKQLLKDMITYFDKSNIYKKLQVVSLLKSIEYYSCL